MEIRRSVEGASPMSPNLERALRWAAVWHEGQVRKGSGVPYVIHPVAVGLILDRLGWPEDVVIAGLLHDVVEDTGASVEDVRARFGPSVAELVRSLSEIKLDPEGRKRPWIDRKTDHIAALSSAPIEARAVALADKLHNLLSIRADLGDGRPVWSLFHADRDQVLWYYRTCIDRYGGDEPRLRPLVEACREALREVEGR